MSSLFNIVFGSDPDPKSLERSDLDPDHEKLFLVHNTAFMTSQYFLTDSLSNSQPESIERFMVGQAFLRSYDLAPRPPHAPFPSVTSTGDTRED